MASLKDYVYGYEEGTAIVPGEFVVYNTNVTSHSNGGQCCCWIVPAGVSYAVFEIWAGGGGAAGGCCCIQGPGAGNGGYAIKALNVCPNDAIIICAATSTQCSTQMTNGACGCHGCCSTVCNQGQGGGTTCLIKVCGGHYSYPYACCFMDNNCYTCCSMCYCCQGLADNVDQCWVGTMGHHRRTQYCRDDAWMTAATAPMTGGNPFMSWNPCCGQGGSAGFGHFPGGGGQGVATAGNTCCCGSPGAGGMVYVVYY